MWINEEVDNHGGNMTGNMDYNNGNRLGRTEQGLCAENCIDEDISLGIGMVLVRGGAKTCCTGDSANLYRLMTCSGEMRWA